MFQYTNYTEPIRQFIDDSLFFELDTNLKKSANMFIQRAEITRQDDIFLGSKKR
jgi:hypothetical protein